MSLVNLKKFCIFLIILFSLANSISYAEEMLDIYRNYWSFNFVDAISELNEKIENSENRLEKVKTIASGLELCETYWLEECQSLMDIFANEINQADKNDTAFRPYYAIFDLYKIPYDNFYVDDTDIVSSAISSEGIDLIPHEIGFNNGIKAQLYLSEYYYEKNNFEEARRSIYRALSMIASLDNPLNNTLAKQLAHSIEALTLVGEPILASQIYKFSADFIGQNSFASKPDFAKWRTIEAQHLLTMGDFNGAKKAYEQAFDLYKYANVSDSLKRINFASDYILYSAICIFLNDLESLKSSIENNPFTLAINNPNEFETLNTDWRYFELLLIKGVYDYLQNQKVSEKIINEIKEWKGYKSSDLHAEHLRAYAFFVISLNQNNIHDEAKYAAQTIVRILDYQKNNNPYGYTHVHPLQRLVLFGGLSKIAEENKKEDHGLALSIIDYLKTDYNYLEARDLVALANANNTQEQKEIHTVLRLERNRNIKLIEDIELTLKRTKENTENINSNNITKYVEFDNKISIIKNNLVYEFSKVPVSISIGDIQKNLTYSDAFVTSTALNNKIVTLCISHDESQLRTVEVETNKALLNLKLLRLALTRQDAINPKTDNQFPLDSSKYLYDVILKPVSNCLKDKKHLTWVPFSDLNGIPIEIMITDKNERNNDLKNQKWLIKSHTISYAINSSSFISSKALSKTTTKNNTFLGLGDPVIQKETLEASTINLSKINYRDIANYTELPETSDEILASKMIFGSDSNALLKKNFTEDNFRKNFLNQYEVISFATHGFMPGEIDNLDESSLLSTPINISNSFNDGLLKSSEISDLNISANLILLSACNTSSRSIGESKDVIDSLTFAFSKAGAPNIIGSLWPVESNSTKQIIQSFNKFYSKGNSISESLRKAKIDFIDNNETHYANPRFWSAFIAQGNGNSYTNKQNKTSITQTKILDYKGGGEYRDIIKYDNNVFFYGFGEIQENGRAKALIQSVSENFDMISNIQHNELAIHYLINYENRLVGYGYKTPIANASELYLFEIKDNQITNETKICIQCNEPPELLTKFEGDLHTISSSYSNKEGATTLFLNHRIYDNQFNEIIAKSHKIHEDGSQSYLDFSNFMAINNKIFFVVRRNYFQKPTGNLINPFGLANICEPNYESIIYSIDLRDQKLVKLASINDKVDKIHNVNNRILLSGNKNQIHNCLDNKKMFVSELIDNNVKSLYIDDSLSFTSASEIIKYKDNYYLSGTISREFSNRDISIQRILDGESEKTQNYIIKEGLIVKFDKDFNIIEKKYYPTGYSTYFGPAYLFDNNLYIGGAVNFQPSIFRLKLH